jgi:hypothetical protein
VSAVSSKLRKKVYLQLSETLPRPAYEITVKTYNQARAVAKRGPGQGRMLPSFIIIGAAKCGTTSLYHWLVQHPSVAPAATKEVHYFDYNYFRGLDWYRSHFPLEAEADAFAAEHGRPFITGEASASYISHFWVPERMAALLPDVKLFVALRDPVDRAYSQYQLSRHEKLEPLDSFDDALDAEDRRLDPERIRMWDDRRYSSYAIGAWSYQMRSRYAEQLERWFKFFDRSQIHFLTMDELAHRPDETMDAVHQHLGLPAHRYEHLTPRNKREYDSLSPTTRARLQEYFRPHNERLYDLVGRDFGW